MKKILVLSLGMVMAISADASSFKLVDTEHTKGDRDNSPTTSYTYKSVSPFTVEYIYGYDMDYGENNLRIKFDYPDVKETYLGTIQILVLEEAGEFTQKLNLATIELKEYCSYHGKAKIEFDEVYVTRNDITSSSFGSIFLKQIKPIGAAKLECDAH